MSANDTGKETLPQGCELGIAAEAFYITNMILAPGLGFIMLVFLYFHCSRKHAPAFALNHLRQTLVATFWAGLIAAAFVGLIYATGGYPSPYFWSLLGFYFIAIHLPLCWFGLKGLDRALAGKEYRYPVVGARLLSGGPTAA